MRTDTPIIAGQEVFFVTANLGDVHLGQETDEGDGLEKENFLER